MATNSYISWCDNTHNEWWGCTQCSEGCRECYAKALAHRFRGMPWGVGAPRVLTSEENRNLPYKWNKAAQQIGIRKRVFTASMSDIFDSEVPLEWLGALLEKVDATPYLDWLLLTKRASGIKERLQALGVWNSWPRPNIWLGVSAENQRWADERIPYLLEVPAHVHFLSCEPLLGPITIPRIREIDWIIAGGESGPRFRPMHPDWPRTLRDQCVENNVAYHFKQWGTNKPTAAGCLLDGREWKEFPRTPYTLPTSAAA